MYNVHVEEEKNSAQQSQSIIPDSKEKSAQKTTLTCGKADDGLKTTNTQIQNFVWKISEEKNVTLVNGKREKAIDIAGKSKNKCSKQVFDLVKTKYRRVYLNTQKKQ